MPLSQMFDKNHLAMPLSQMFDKVFDMIKSDMGTTRGQDHSGVRYSKAGIKVL